jgi:hypothetical protein
MRLGRHHREMKIQSRCKGAVAKPAFPLHGKEGAKGVVVSPAGRTPWSST